MDKYIKIGIGVMILDGNKILLGHRAKDKKDTGGIFEVDCWTLPGGKQEYNETFFDGAKREVKEETNLDIDELELFDAADDIQPDRHYITMHVIAKKHSGELKIMEPTKEDKWKWFDLDNLPEKLYSPSKKFIENYLNNKNKLNKEFAEEWLKKLKDYWFNKDIEKAVSLFTKTTFYQETPFMKPYTTIEEINQEWQHIKNENIQDIDLKVLAIDNNTLIAEWLLKQNNQEFDGIYEIKFNDDLECICFKSWEMNK